MFERFRDPPSSAQSQVLTWCSLLTKYENMLSIFERIVGNSTYDANDTL